MTGQGPGHSDPAPAWVGQSWVTASSCFQGARHHTSPAHLAILLLPSTLLILVRARRRPGGRGMDGQTQQEAPGPQAWREPGVLHSWHPRPSCPRCKTPWVSKGQMSCYCLKYCIWKAGDTAGAWTSLTDKLLEDWQSTLGGLWWHLGKHFHLLCGKKSKPLLSLGLGESLQSFQEAGLIPLRWNLMQCQIIFSSKPVLLEKNDGEENE